MRTDPSPRRLPAAILALLAAVAPTAARAGLAVTGRVTADRRPLPGAEVTLVAAAWDPALKPSAPLGDREPAARTRSAADGTFRLPVPAPGLWRVRIEAAGYTGREITLVPLLADRRLETVDLLSATTCRLELRDAAGDPVVARLAWRGDSNRGAEGPRKDAWRPASGRTVTDENGLARVPATSNRAGCAGWALARGLPPVRWQAAAGNTVRVSLPAGAARLVEVRDLSGGVVRGAALFAAGVPLPLAVTDGRGQARIALPPRTSSLLVAAPDGRWTEAPLGAELGSEPTPIILRLLPPTPVAGRVIDGDSGRPLAGALVWSHPPPPLLPALVTSDERGRFSFPVVGGLGPQLSAAAPWYRTTTVEAARPSSFDIALQGRGRGLGRVADENGRGIAGVRVRLSARAVSAGEPVPQSSATTGPDGTFSLSRLRPGRYDLELTAEGFRRLRIPGIVVPDLADDVDLDLGLLTLLRGKALCGRVLDPDGRPIASAAIEAVLTGASPADAGRAMAGLAAGAESDTGGDFRLEGLPADREVDLHISRPGFVPAEIAAVHVPRADPLEVVLEPASSLAGRVLDDRLQPVADALVRVVRRGDPATGGTAPPSERYAVSDADGRFTVANVPPGRFDLTVRAAGFLEEERTDLGVHPGEEPIDLEIRLQPGAAIAGTVRDASGRPVPHAVVLLSPPAAGATSEVVRSDLEGGYRFIGLAAGVYSVAAEDGGRRVTRRADVAGAGTDVDLTLPGGVEVRGRVVTGAGEPIADATVVLLASRVETPSREATTDPAGGFVFPDVPPGPYSLLARREGLAPAPPGPPITVGDRPLAGIELSLSLGVVVHGRVAAIGLEDLAGVVIRASSTGGVTRAAGVGADGSFTLPPLPAGDVLLEATADGGRLHTRRLLHLDPAEPEVTVELVLGAG